MTRTRLLIFGALVLVAIGVVVALALVNQPRPAPATPATGGGTGASAPVAPAVAQAVATQLPTPTPIPFIEVVIAIQDIPRGTRVTANTVALVPWPEVAAPVNAYSNPEDVIGKIARTDIFREQIVLSNTLVDDFQSLASTGSDAAAIIPPNRVAVAVPMDRITSVAYAIKPGDRVDVIVSMLFVDVDPNFQSLEPNSFTSYNITLGESNPALPSFVPVSISLDGVPLNGTFDSRIVPGGLTVPVIISPSESQRPRLTTQRTVQDALVIWVGDFPIDGRIFRPAPTPTPVQPTATPSTGNQANQQNQPVPTQPPPRPDIITLAVSPQDAVVLTWLAEAGIPLTFALRSAASPTYPGTDAVTLDYIMTRFNIAVPEKFDYSIEPAIRNIRQLEVGNRISLKN
jgi:pilus assembly protein CpaB